MVGRSRAWGARRLHAAVHCAAWVGLLAPAGTPRAIVDQLNHQVHAILAGEDVKSHLREAGMEVAPIKPVQLKAVIAQQRKLHAELVQAAGLVPP